MSRYIDADALFAEFENVGWYNNADRDEIAERLVLQAPTIDAVSVVRCRECRHKYQEPWNNGVAVEGECEIWHSATLADDYCSYGEREGE